VDGSLKVVENAIMETPTGRPWSTAGNQISFSLGKRRPFSSGSGGFTVPDGGESSIVRVWKRRGEFDGESREEERRA
jgi:hypothetical protein